MTFRGTLGLVAGCLSVFFCPPAGASDSIHAPAVAEAVQSVVVVLPRWKGVRQGFAPRTADGRIAPEGSGVAVRPGGLIATNDHVLGDAVSVRVRLADGRTLPAEIIGRHKATDIALLKVAVDVPTAKPGPEPGLASPVCAIGNPFGRGISVSCGVVSAIGRANAGFNEIEDFIQTDAAVNPGGSGGALVDGKGRLVGLVSAIFAQGADANIGVNFAASRQLLDRVVDDLADDGTVRAATARLETGAISPVQAGQMSGIAVVEVTQDGPAFRAGIEAGDIITAIAGKAVATSGQFRALLFRHRPGEQVDFQTLRGGEPRTLTVTLDAAAP